MDGAKREAVGTTSILPHTNTYTHNHTSLSPPTNKNQINPKQTKTGAGADGGVRGHVGRYHGEAAGVHLHRAGRPEQGALRERRVFSSSFLLFFVPLCTVHTRVAGSSHTFRRVVPVGACVGVGVWVCSAIRRRSTRPGHQDDLPGPLPQSTNTPPPIPLIGDRRVREGAGGGADRRRGPAAVRRGAGLLPQDGRL